MDHRHLDDIYELYLLGLLPEKESLAIKEHLERRCLQCLARLSEAAQTVYALTLIGWEPRPAKAARGARRRRKKQPHSDRWHG
jgi:anti-sigma factor RsiW